MSTEMILYNGMYYPAPSKHDLDVISRATGMGASRWADAIDLEDECDGDYAKEYIHDWCTTCYHREEAQYGME